MNPGTLTFHRFNGIEKFSLQQAELFLLDGDDESSPRLSFEFEAAKPPLATLPDTEALRASPSGEFTIDVPSLDTDQLVGQSYTIPKGDVDGNWLARIYYVEHDAANDCIIRLLARDGDRFQVTIEGSCTDLNFYDGSQPDTRFVLEAWFTIH